MDRTFHSSPLAEEQETALINAIPLIPHDLSQPSLPEITKSKVNLEDAQSGFSQAATAPAPRLRFEFLDGLRGLAALYVMLFHLQLQFAEHMDRLPSFWRSLIDLMRYGHYAVAVFIVLSGYCLMLPIARSQDGQLRGGAWQYLKRRAWRILPSYYIVLLLSILLPMITTLVFCAVHALHHKVAFDFYSATGLTSAFPRNLCLHLLLIHNWVASSSLTINAPMWSIALEWQIYFLLPALLLPVWRRTGLMGLVIVATCVGLLPHFALPHDHNFEWTCPWYLGLFALGMSAAVIGSGKEGRVNSALKNAPWGWICIGLTAVFVGLAIHSTAWITALVSFWKNDFLMGAITTSLLLHCTRLAQVAHFSGRRGLILRMLEAKWLLFVGTFSYSLYLVHGPIVSCLHFLIACLHPAPAWRIGFQFLAGIPLSLIAGYLFYLAVERRFLGMPPARHTGATHAFDGQKSMVLTFRRRLRSKAA